MIYKVFSTCCFDLFVVYFMFDDHLQKKKPRVPGANVHRLLLTDTHMLHKELPDAVLEKSKAVHNFQPLASTGSNLAGDKSAASASGLRGRPDQFEGFSLSEFLTSFKVGAAPIGHTPSPPSFSPGPFFTAAQPPAPHSPAHGPGRCGYICHGSSRATF